MNETPLQTGDSEMNLSKRGQLIAGAVIIGFGHLIGGAIMAARPTVDYEYGLVAFTGAVWFFLFTYDWGGGTSLIEVLTSVSAPSGPSNLRIVLAFGLGLAALLSSIGSWVTILLLPVLDDWRHRLGWLFSIQSGYGIGQIILAALIKT